MRKLFLRRDEMLPNLRRQANRMRNLSERILTEVEVGIYFDKT
jgi:hypothetical protein